MEFACRNGISEFIVIRQTDQPTGLFHIPVGCTPHSQPTEYCTWQFAKRLVISSMIYPSWPLYPIELDCQLQ